MLGSGYLSFFNPDKLHVEFREGITSTEPILHRRYTLTHSDLTADLFFDSGIKICPR
ncbi:staygreen family protein [Alkalibacillus salilacus]|uniref:staygreen family protein n=1 Tax=Alkalibacillus salilacus TaxID=284582 RepID=UPI0027D88920|nr:staygreen family protein [Alkalibacillus salilacus]